jgi:two-component system, NarL family, response regulator LiaR
MSESTPIRVMLVDDHAVVRSGLIAFLMVFDDLEMVGEAGSGEEALALVEKLRPDVILMDLVMSGLDGAETTRLIRQRYQDVQVVVLTSFPEEDLVTKALKAGAISYLLKNVAADELASAIRRANAGRSTLAPEAAQALIHSTTQPPKPGHDLTEREREVLALMAQGFNNVEIAENLIVSRSTVKFHVSNILSKLHASSRTEAVAIAMENGLIERSN